MVNNQHDTAAHLDNGVECGSSTGGIVSQGCIRYRRIVAIPAPSRSESTQLLMKTLPRVFPPPPTSLV